MIGVLDVREPVKSEDWYTILAVMAVGLGEDVDRKFLHLTTYVSVLLIIVRFGHSYSFVRP